MSVQAWLNRIWYERPAPPWWLMPLSCLYGLIVGVRSHSYAKGWRRAVRVACPVVVVGNLSVGGTGKTPLVCWLASHLAAAGLKPGIVTRGYGGSASSVRQVSPSDDPAVVGDEPVLLARRSGVPVAIGRDRPAAAQLLLQAGCDVIVSDDGLQHYALVRDCEVVVIDGDRRFGNGWLLPGGPLREAPSRLRRADVVVVNGGRALLDAAFSMRLEAHKIVCVSDGASRALNSLVGETVHAIAGIGHPERFFNMLRAHGIDVIGHPLGDHAQLQAGDISFGDARHVLMTEKDAVKCAVFAGPKHWYVPVTACFEGAESKALLDIVTAKIAEFHKTSRESIHG